MERRAPTVVIVAVATAALLAAATLGGPRTGYVPGIVISTAVVLTIMWRYRPPLYIQWLTALLLASYHGGGVLIVGSDVLAHVALGGSILRYDRGLHVFGAVVTVLLIVVVADRSHARGTWSVLGLALVAGFAVEATELFNALVMPTVFSYDLVDSSLDVAGNVAGLAIGFAILIWMDRQQTGNQRNAAT
ncbi:MAG: hypothetical protein U9N78_01135 [Actinomycetota bacterium]|nr:hypothetical protein [Actinomycetota bacterium]